MGPEADVNPEDRLLIERARQDPMAFAEVYRRHHARVYNYLRLRTLTAEEAADLTHEVFFKALDALPRYQERGLPVIAWLMRIARNSAIDAARKRHPSVDFALVPETVFEESEANPEVAVLARERLNQLRVAVLRLDRDKRDVLALRFRSGLSSREIGLVTGKSEAAVKKQITRTLHELRKRLQDVV